MGDKLVCIAYGPDTRPIFTREYVNRWTGVDTEWVQINAWKLGDGDPGICIPAGVSETDPIVTQLWTAYVEAYEDGDLLEEELDEYLSVVVSTKDAVLLFVQEN